MTLEKYCSLASLEKYHVETQVWCWSEPTEISRHQQRDCFSQVSGEMISEKTKKRIIYFAGFGLF